MRVIPSDQKNRMLLPAQIEQDADTGDDDTGSHAGNFIPPRIGAGRNHAGTKLLDVQVTRPCRREKDKHANDDECRAEKLLHGLSSPFLLLNPWKGSI